MFSTNSTTARLAAALGAGALALGMMTGCSNDAPANKHTHEADAKAHSGIKLVDGWAKSAKTGDMTAAFGTLKNTTKKDLKLVGAESDVSSMVQLHETTMEGGQMKMQEKKDGFTIPAGKSHEFKPGGDHIMFMKLDKDVLAGNDLTMTLKFDDGSKLKVTVPVRDFKGAQEEYAPGDHDQHMHEHGDGHMHEHGEGHDHEHGEGHDHEGHSH